MRNKNRYHVADVNYLKYIYTCSIQQQFEMYRMCSAVTFSNMYIVVRHVVSGILGVCTIVERLICLCYSFYRSTTRLLSSFYGRRMGCEREHIDAQIFTPPQGPSGISGPINKSPGLGVLSMQRRKSSSCKFNEVYSRALNNANVEDK